MLRIKNFWFSTSIIFGLNGAINESQKIKNYVEGRRSNYKLEKYLLSLSYYVKAFAIHTLILYHYPFICLLKGPSYNFIINFLRRKKLGLLLI